MSENFTATNKANLAAAGKGFLGSLFDLSFSEMVTTKIIKILYIISIFASGLTALATIFTGFSNSIVAGILTLILAPIVFLFYVIFARMSLELVVVVFKIAENTELIARK